jgi:PAS domain S-box-containing protein
LLRTSDFLINRSPACRYGFALAMLILATTSRFLLNPIMGESHLFPIFFVALILTTWFAGTGPGIMFLGLGLACAIQFFVQPRFGLVVPREHLVGLLLYLFVGVAHIVTNHLYRSSQRKLEQRTCDLTATNTALEAEVGKRRRVEVEVQRLATIVSSSTDAILGLTLEGSITDWNSGSERLYGYPRSRILGQPVMLLIPTDRAGEFQQVLDRVKQGEGVEPFETARRRSDGREILVSLSVSPIWGDNGLVVGAAEIARDLTATKRLEEQLFQARKMEAVGRLAGGVAHDFNNILMIITGLNEMVLAEITADQPAQQHAMEIKETADRGTNLIKQLLAFSRAQIIAPRLLNLNSLIVNLERMLHRLIGEDVELQLDLEPHLGAIKADPGQIELVLMNLAVNARDAMPRGGKLTLSTATVVDRPASLSVSAEFPNQPSILLTVQDTGCGMDEHIKAHLFEPFFTTKQSEKGTGLGLATVYAVVQQCGGHIEVFSKPGCGTTFEIYLARQEGTPEGPGPSKVQEAAGGQETVLLVEDEPVLRRLAGRMLRRQGYQVLEAAGGPEALHLAQQSGPINLLITDVVMPQMSGRQLADQLRPSHPGMTVLYLSGYTDDTVVRHGVQEEKMNFLSKPCSLDVLAGKVRDLLDGGGHR